MEDVDGEDGSADGKAGFGKLSKDVVCSYVWEIPGCNGGQMGGFW